MINLKKIIAVVFSFLFLFSHSSMGMEAKVKKEAFFDQDFPSAIVQGKIVFQSNRDGALSEIWVLENGQIKKIASGKNTDKNIPKQLSGPLASMLSGAFADLEKPKWSPDGKAVLCLQDKQLVILNTDGTNKVIIQPAKYPLSAIWSPDGSAIYYVATDRLPQGGGSQNIYRLNLSDKFEKRITDLAPLPGVRSILSIAVSHDEKKIAFVMVGEKKYGISIWTINTDGSDLQLLT